MEVVSMFERRGQAAECKVEHEVSAEFSKSGILPEKVFEVHFEVRKQKIVLVVIRVRAQERNYVRMIQGT